MNGTKDAFDSYMDMILSSEVNESFESGDNLRDFDDIDADEDLDVYRSIFISKEDSLVPDEEAEYSWRENYDYDFDYNIDPDDYETEEEYLEALEEAHLDMDESEYNPKQDFLGTTSLGVEPKPDADGFKVYDYCKVAVDTSNMQYDYLSGALELSVSDRVLVPLGNDGKNATGTVVAVGKCLSSVFTCDINEMKVVVKLLEHHDNSKELTSSSKKDSNNDNLVYEDDYIKISFVKWARQNYLTGGYARTGSFIFENKYDKRFCIYLKDISVDGFLNQAESWTVALSGKQKELKEMPFVYENRIPEVSKEYRTIEFKVCYGTIKDGMSSIHLINKPIIESEIISIKV